MTLVLALAAGCLAGCGGSSDSAGSGETITVLNYGKYIDEDAVKQFEKETGINVKYEEYESPEEMYTKYKAGSIDYDVICSSEYMVEKLIKEGEVLEMDYAGMENYKNLDSTIVDMTSSYDKDHTYSHPYFYGTLGLLYNKNEVGYYVDETADAMIGEEALIALCYSGEAALAMNENENLDYSVPEEGSNLWIDSWFVPKTCKNQDAAMQFLNFICRDDIAEANFEYVQYASPITSVVENQDADIKANEAINPSSESIKRCEIYTALDDESTKLYSNLWQELLSN